NGAIIDALRRVSPGSRAARRDYRAYDQVRGEMIAELGREPAEAEVAARLNLDLSRLEDMHRYRTLRVVSIDAEVDSSGERDIGADEDTEEYVLSRVEALEVRSLIATLMPREREIIFRHYIEGHSQ